MLRLVWPEKVDRRKASIEVMALASKTNDDSGEYWVLVLLGRDDEGHHEAGGVRYQPAEALEGSWIHGLVHVASVSSL